MNGFASSRGVRLAASGAACAVLASCGGKRPVAEASAGESAPTESRPARIDPGPAPEPARKAGPPNVLFIAIDDLNDWVGCMGGHPDVKTPNIDRLAARGVLFTHAYCPAPLSGPSRTAIMTGLAPSRSGVFTGGDIVLRDTFPGLVTMPEYFKLHGYETVGAGKVFHYPNDEQSWDQYFHTGGYPEPAVKPACGIALKGVFDWAALDAPYEDFVDTKHVRWILDRMGEPRDKPAFVGVGIIRPHLPWYNPRPFFDMYDRDAIAIPENPPWDLDDIGPVAKGFAIGTGDHEPLVQHDAVRDAVQAYLASITYADSLVGLLLDELDRSPQADNTIVVLWSDHGWHLGEKGHWRKVTAWERAARVPFIVALPGGAHAGERIDEAVNLMDMFPTLIEACGLPPRQGVDGQSLMPWLRDPRSATRRVSITNLSRTASGLSDGRWRFISYGNGEEELYDHASDPSEWHNLAAVPGYESVVAEFRALVPPVAPPDPVQTGAAVTIPED